MTINYHVTEQDYINFNIFHLNNSAHGKSVKQAVKYMLPIVLFALFAVINDFTINEKSIIHFGFAAIFSVIWLVFFGAIYNEANRRQVVHFLRNSKNNDFIGEQTLTLKDDVIETKNSTALSTVAYSAVKQIFLAYDCYFVYIGDIKAFLIPQSAFENTKQEKEMLDALKQKSGIDITVGLK